MAETIDEKQEAANYPFEQFDGDPLVIVMNIIDHFSPKYTALIEKVGKDVMAADPSFLDFFHRMDLDLSVLELAYERYMTTEGDPDEDVVAERYQFMLRLAVKFEKLGQEIAKALKPFGIECPPSQVDFYQQEQARYNELEKSVVEQDAIVSGFSALLEIPDYPINPELRKEAKKLLKNIPDLEKWALEFRAYYYRYKSNDIDDNTGAAVADLINKILVRYFPEEDEGIIDLALNMAEINKEGVDYLRAISVIAKSALVVGEESGGKEFSQAYLQIIGGLNQYCLKRGALARARVQEIYDETHTK
jgi:hypothetical protein